MKKYKNLFFDLDDTVWAFSHNAKDTFKDLYVKYNFAPYFQSFEHFYELYEKKNKELWALYGDGKITKEELNATRFSYPLQVVGHYDATLCAAFEKDFFQLMPQKKELMPFALEVLSELSKEYNLYILSNGFKECQYKKIESAGISHFFKRVILSDDIGVMKPWPEIYHFALSATQSFLNDSLMIGDNINTDIKGAFDIGMDQIYYGELSDHELPFKPTYVVSDLRKILTIL